MASVLEACSHVRNLNMFSCPKPESVLVSEGIYNNISHYSHDLLFTNGLIVWINKRINCFDLKRLTAEMRFLQLYFAGVLDVFSYFISCQAALAFCKCCCRNVTKILENDAKIHQNSFKIHPKSSQNVNFLRL